MLALFSYWFFESAFRKPAPAGEPSDEEAAQSKQGKSSEPDAGPGDG
jgi:hypothetical protein